MSREPFDLEAAVVDLAGRVDEILVRATSDEERLAVVATILQWYTQSHDARLLCLAGLLLSRWALLSQPRTGGATA